MYSPMLSWSWNSSSVDADGVAPCTVDEVEFPAGRHVVGSVEYAALAGVFGRAVVGKAAGGEGSAGDGFEIGFAKLVVDPEVEAFAVGRHEAVEHGGFDVGEFGAAEELEDAGLDEAVPVDDVAVVFFEAGEHPRDDHFVGLFVEFGEFDRARVVVPALHAGGVEDGFK